MNDLGEQYLSSRVSLQATYFFITEIGLHRIIEELLHY